MAASLMSRVKTVAFAGIEVIDVDVQVSMTGGLVAFTIVGLPDKAVAESRERVRSALAALGLALPAKRITVNLAPADVLKEGSHFDLPIATALLISMGILPADEVAHFLTLGELGLDGALAPVSGVLVAAFGAVERDLGLLCPAPCGSEAAWANPNLPVLAPANLMDLIQHMKGTALLPRPLAKLAEEARPLRDLTDVKGQETAKRALEIAAAGGHNLLMVGPPGSGKSMLAQRLPGLLPPLSPREALSLAMIQSVAGQWADGKLTRRRPFRDPHHSASLAALVGGGQRARPGEVSLAHHGVLFLDELPEFNRSALEALRQPLESGRISVARANAHVTYPARVQLVAAMNPCRCGFLGDPARSCGKAPRCGVEYQAKISGPLLDRIDLHVEVAAVAARDLANSPTGEASAAVAARVAKARALQAERFKSMAISTNAEADGDLLTTIASLDAAGQALLTEATDRLHLSARGYHRVLRVARTLADLGERAQVSRLDIAEALAYRGRPSGVESR